jgi:hypothetical protein
MANEEHLALLRKGVEEWNAWRRYHMNIVPDFSGANFSDANLSQCMLNHANFSDADVSDVNLSHAHLWAADFSRAHLSHTNLSNANLGHANLSHANFSRVNLTGVNLYNANLNSTDLTGADLTRANLINAQFTNAKLSGCRIFGISTWNIKLDGITLSDLIVTQHDEADIIVDDLETAQLVNWLLDNRQTREYYGEWRATKTVFILGRFRPERKAGLDAIREELRHRQYIPIVFDFDKPLNQNLTETVMALASMARFVITDLSDPHSIPHDLMYFARDLYFVPIQPIFGPVPVHPNEYSMIEHLQRYPHVLPTFRYESQDDLIAQLAKKVIDPAEKKALEMKSK